MLNIRKLTGLACFVACTTAFIGCSGSSNEAERVELTVRTAELDSQTVTTDLGWTVELQTFRASVADVTFTTDGEQHLESNALLDLLVPNARAHPGHQAGGEVIGGLPGHHVLDWTAPARDLGQAEFIVGDYTGANFRYTRGTTEHGLEADDDLVGHSVIIEGTARRDADEVRFRALVDQDEERRVIGLPFTAGLDEDASGTVSLHVHPSDPQEGDTLFDGIDFEPLVGQDAPVVLEAGTEPYNRLRRALQVHDHFSASYDQ